MLKRMMKFLGISAILITTSFGPFSTFQAAVAASPSGPLAKPVPTVQIIPSSGPQGTYVKVYLSGFPAHIPVQVGLHKLNRKLIESTATSRTNAFGQAWVPMRIPTGANINNNRVWLAKVSTTKKPKFTVTSSPFNVTGN
jgi:hypothetical protein